MFVGCTACHAKGEDVVSDSSRHDNQGVNAPSVSIITSSSRSLTPRTPARGGGVPEAAGLARPGPGESSHNRLPPVLSAESRSRSRGAPAKGEEGCGGAEAARPGTHPQATPALRRDGACPACLVFGALTHSKRFNSQMRPNLMVQR